MKVRLLVTKPSRSRTAATTTRAPLITITSCHLVVELGQGPYSARDVTTTVITGRRAGPGARDVALPPQFRPRRLMAPSNRKPTPTAAPQGLRSTALAAVRRP